MIFIKKLFKAPQVTDAHTRTHTAEEIEIWPNVLVGSLFG